MTLYELFKIIHILAASAWVGGALLTQFQAARALKMGGADLEHFMWEQQKVGPRFFAPMSLIVVIAGVVMVIDSGIDFEDLWIAIGIAAFVATFITGMFVLKPRVEKIVELLQGGKAYGYLLPYLDPDFRAFPHPLREDHPRVRHPTLADEVPQYQDRGGVAVQLDRRGVFAREVRRPAEVGVQAQPTRRRRGESWPSRPATRAARAGGGNPRRATARRPP